MDGNKETEKQISEMLNVLDGKPAETPFEEEDLSEEERAAKEKEAADAAKAKEDEEAKLAEEEKRKNETDEERAAREAKEVEDEEKLKAEAEAKEKETLAAINAEKEAREKEEEAARIKAEEEAKKKDESLKLDEQDFIGEQDLDELIHDKEAFNKLLNAVYIKGVNDSKRIATEGVLNSIPDIVKHNLTLLTTLKEASDKFYAENKELIPYKKVVAAVFEDIASKNPDKKYDELMNLVAPEARKRLNLQKQAAEREKKNDDKDGKPPRLHGAKGGSQKPSSQKPNTSSLADEISEMNKYLGR